MIKHCMTHDINTINIPQYNCGTAHDDSDMIIGYDANYNVSTVPQVHVSTIT